MANNKLQPHGVFRNDQLVWTFPSRSQAFKYFGISVNGQGTKAAVASLQKDNKLPLAGAPNCDLRCIDKQTFFDTKLDFTITSEIVTRLKQGEEIIVPRYDHHYVRCNGNCKRRLPWTEEHFSPDDRASFSALRTTCRDCRKQKCRDNEVKFKERIVQMKKAGETHFTCNACNNYRHLSLISSDRMECRPCVDGKKRKLHAHKTPDSAPDGKPCATCSAAFDRNNFGWRYDTGSWRLQCNDCCRLPYECALCTQFKVPTEISLCHVCRRGEDRVKRFEEEMKEFLQERGLLWSYHNQIFPCAAPGVLRRPDFVIVFATFILIIEVDEHYHKFYTPECELKRIEQLHETAKQPIILVRFNPQSRHYGILGNLLDEIIRNGGREAKEDNAFGVYIYFIGYPYSRILVMRDHMDADIGAFFPFQSVGEIA